MYTLIPNKSYGQLFDISPKTFIVLKTFDSEFSYEVLFTHQKSKPLEKEDTAKKIHLKLLQIQLKLLQKEQFKQKQKQLLI